MIDISTVPNVDTPTANLIYGVLQDDIIPGDGEGTPVRKDWQSDPYYALIAVMNAAGVVADGSPEGATSSQFLTALRKVTKDTMYPVGSFYVQYPDAASNDDATAFPTSKRPATLYGGTWVEQFNTDATFFRTGGTDGQTRTNGLSADQMQVITGSFKTGANGGLTDLAGAFTGATSAQLPSGTAGVASKDISFSSQYTGQRTGTKTEPINRLFKIWKRTVL